MKLEHLAPMADIDPLHTEANPGHDVGTEVRVADGRVFRYAKAGAANISAGKLQLAPAPKTNHHNMVTATAVAGALQVTVTLGNTAAVANEYAGGYLIINAGTGLGIAYKVKSHPAANALATMLVTLFDGITVATAVADTKSTLMHNGYNGVVEGTSSTQRPAGIPLVAITAAQYGWLQVGGIAPALADETLTLGALLTAGTSTAGAVEEYDDDTTPDTDNIVGFAVVAGVDGEYRPINLNIA